MIIVPAEDLAALLGRHAPRTPLPSIVHVVADLDAALDVLESHTVVRASQPRPAGQAWSPVLLAARAPERQARRLQAVLDNGSTVGIAGLLLGQWPSGVTAYVRDDGTISTTNPGLGEPLRGARLFRLGDDHTADLLALLHSADHDSGSRPTTSRPRPSVVPPPREFGTDGSESPTVVGTAQGCRGDTVAERVTAGGSGAWRDDRNLEILGPAIELAAVIPPRSQPPPHRPATAPSQPGEPGGFTSQTALSRTAGAPEGPRDRGPADDGPRGPGSADSRPLLAPLRISVLGPLQVWWRPPVAAPHGLVEHEITSAFQPRLRELLVFLAVHPDGVSREALLAALWASSSPVRSSARTTNAMNTSLSRIRRALAAATDGAVSDVVLAGEGRYRLDPNLVDVDYWSFAAAVATRRAATDDKQRIEAYRCIVDSYRGPLADGLSTDWIETAREAVRRDAIDAVAALARALVAQDPQQTLDLLEIARAFDPHNELIYRDIMRLQERLGQLDAIPRTLTLLTTRLAEIDEQPTHHTVDLAEGLRGRHDLPVGDLPADPTRANLRHGRAG